MHRSTSKRNLAAAAIAALGLTAGDAGAQFAVSQLPVLNASPPTNIVMMVDDSGSMQWAYVPDGMSANTGTKRFTAGSFNALSYNPSITYPAPVIVDSTGATRQLYTCFSPSQPCQSLSGGATNLSGSTNAGAFIDGFNTAAGSVDMATNYQPTSSYAPGSNNQQFSANPDPATVCAPAANCTGAPAYYYVYDVTLATCTFPSVTSDSCYRYVRVSTTSGPGGTDETQNFANWYSFYRIRHLMIASAAAITMADSSLTQARVTWRALNTCQDMTDGNDCAGWDGQVVDNRIRTFTGNQRINFYQWLTHVPANNTTPTRSTWKYIGDYFSDTTLGVNGPYGLNPNQPNTDPNSGEIACVQNYNITLTDGQWNQDNNGTFFGTADASSASFPSQLLGGSTGYTPSTAAPTAIYGNDANRDVLADEAFHYWVTNLRPDLNGSATAVRPYYQVTTGTGGTPTALDDWNPQNDPARWPHLVQMTIGIGMTNTMTAAGLPWWGNNPATQYSSAGYMNLWNGTNMWPAINNTAMQGDIGKAYDLWHAAINSRGLAFSAESPKDLIASLKSSLNRIKVPMAGQSAAAVNSTALSTGNLLYVASFTSVDWHGTLNAFALTANSIAATPTWSSDTAGTFASATTRSIFTANTATTTATASTQGIDFSTASGSFNTIWGSVAAASGLSSTDSANILSWLRGDATQELRNGGSWRNRYTSVLGDIIDSAPTFSWHEDFGYAALPEGMAATPNYQAFVSTKANAKGSIYTGAGMVYVGANDGMLHGFDGATGREVFGYVPHDVIPNLPALADPAYAHRFYVDQTPYVGDACLNGSGPLNAGCSWKTVLVGTTGAGGQGVFALDVTDPTQLESSGNAVGKLLWDLDGKGPTDANGDPDLGYPIGKPIIARLHDGSWAAVFGNGYLSSNACAVLFIVRLSDGAITRIGTSGTAGTTVCNATNINESNGLGPVTLGDVDADLVTDYVYAGDLKGNLWKFDLTAASSGSWRVAFGGSPLFTASPGGGDCALPATSTAPNPCQMITSAPVLGPALPGMTGQMVYFGTGRLFAAGDLATTSPQAFYGVLDNGATPISGGQGALVQETTTDIGTMRTVSTTPVPSTSRGWYMILPDAGERVTISPIILNGFVVFATDVPASNTCNAGGSGWIMAVSATSNVISSNVTSAPTFFTAPTAKGMNGVLFTNGLPEGLVAVSSSSAGTTTTNTGRLGTTSTSSQVIASGTSGQSTIGTQGLAVKGRISWHELAR